MGYDQGRGMASNKELTVNSDLALHFCDPHNSWQLGSNKYMNGLERHYLRKGTYISGYAQQQDAIADEISARPRKERGESCPLAV